VKPVEHLLRLGAATRKDPPRTVEAWRGRTHVRPPTRRSPAPLHGSVPARSGATPGPRRFFPLPRGHAPTRQPPSGHRQLAGAGPMRWRAKGGGAARFTRRSHSH
jgi:hypothetical protein